MVASRRTLLLATLVVLAGGGCSDPYREAPADATTTPTPADSPATTAPVPNTDGAVAEPRPLALLRRRTDDATQFARAYAHAAVNWDWRSLLGRLRRLRRLTAGPLSAELEAAMASLRTDESLARDRPANQGRVLSIASRGRGSRRALVVVTRERETAGGAEPLGPSAHRVYLGTAQRTADGWRMTAWRRAP